MIEIEKSPTADTRTCDFSEVSREQLLSSSTKHIQDVGKGFGLLVCLLAKAASRHDQDKFTDIDGFHRDFLTGFNEKTWLETHWNVSRHHLAREEGVPEDVNLIDILEYIVDCVMAGMARSGSVCDLEPSSELLQCAFQNTVSLLKKNVKVVEEKQ